MKVAKIAITMFACSAMLFSNVAAEFKFEGYDITNATNVTVVGNRAIYGPVYKIYNEIIDGKFTSNMKSEQVPSADVVWEHEGFEADYPHAGYSRLFVEGNWQNATMYNGLLPRWETRWQDYTWELAYPYPIYQRQLTNVPGVGWSWDFGNPALGVPDSEVLLDTGRRVNPDVEYRGYAVGRLKPNGESITSGEQDMFDDFGVACYELAPVDALSAESLSEKANIYDDFGNLLRYDFVMSDRDIARYIASEYGIVASKFLTGPSFHGEPATRDLAAIYLDNSDKGWVWDWDVVVNVEGDENNIDWTYPQYEVDEPYYYYQFLKVNGLALDGSTEKYDQYISEMRNLLKLKLESFVTVLGKNTDPDIEILKNGLQILLEGESFDKFARARLNGVREWSIDDILEFYEIDRLTPEFRELMEYFLGIELVLQEKAELAGVAEGRIPLITAYEVDMLTYDYAKVPRIVRYTGGKASPRVEWKFAFAEAAYPFAEIEQKFLDGKPAIDMNGNAIYRIPELGSGNYANSYMKVTDKAYEIWIEDSRGEDVILYTMPRGGAGGLFTGITSGAIYVR